MSNPLLMSLKEAASELRSGRQKGSGRSFGPNRIRKIRTQLGLTQEEFAEDVGVSIQTVRSWEQGRSVPGVFSTLMLQAFLEKATQSEYI
jgi:putative transcriptional regulator